MVVRHLNIKNMKYYINYDNFEDTKPHFGNFKSDQEMKTGKENSFTTGIKQEAVDFLLNNFGIVWEDEII